MNSVESPFIFRWSSLLLPGLNLLKHFPCSLWPGTDRKKADSTGDKGSQDISLAQKQRPVFHHNYHIFSVPRSECELKSQELRVLSEMYAIIFTSLKGHKPIGSTLSWLERPVDCTLYRSGHNSGHISWGQQGSRTVMQMAVTLTFLLFFLNKKKSTEGGRVVGNHKQIVYSICSKSKTFFRVFCLSWESELGQSYEGRNQADNPVRWSGRTNQLSFSLSLPDTIAVHFLILKVLLYWKKRCLQPSWPCIFHIDIQ